MRVLLTGGTGFLGSHLVKAFLKEGHEVIILKRSSSDTARIADALPNITYYDIDRCGVEFPFSDLGTIDVVVHTATCYGRKEEKISDIFETNTAFPLRLLETAASFKTNTFINTDTSLNKYLNPYVLSKKQFMEWGKLFANNGTIRFINIELEHFYGPGDDDSKFTTHVIKSCLQNLPELKLTSGEQLRDFIYIDDVISAYHLLLNRVGKQDTFSRNYGLGSGESVSIRKFIETVHYLTESETSLKFGAFPYRANEVMESMANIESLKAMGWSPKVDLAEGIAKTIAFESLRH